MVGNLLYECPKSPSIRSAGAGGGSLERFSLRGHRLERRTGSSVEQGRRDRVGSAGSNPVRAVGGEREEVAVSSPDVDDRKPAQPHDWRKLVLELGPLGVFFAVNAIFGKSHGLYPATAALMVATVVALAVSWRTMHRVPIMPLVSGVVVMVFGTLTLILQDELFIKLKPTIVNILFGTVLVGGLAFGKSLLGVVFDSVFDLDAEGWRKLTLRWGLFFFVLAALNEVVWRNFSTDSWVTFKVFGIMPLTFLFALSQVPLIQRHAIESGDEPKG